jgi:hypothetical protein
MNPIEPFTLILFAAACFVLLVMPFLPAWREWRVPSDHEPLPVPVSQTKEPQFLANQFHARMRAALAEGPSREPVLVKADEFNGDGDWRRAAGPVAVTRVETIRSPLRCAQPVFASVDLCVPAGSNLAAVMSTGRLSIGRGTRLTGWAHADGPLDLADSCRAGRRVTSGTALRLARGCSFERLHAPIVCFGEPRHAREPAPACAPGDLARIPGATRRAGGTFRFARDCFLPPGRRYRGSLVVKGALTIGSGSHIEGDVKATGGIVIGPGARVEGAVLSERDIDFMDGAYARGPVVSEASVRLAAGSWIGSPEARSTVSAASIVAEVGAAAHGTVWAHRSGVVWGNA